MRALKAGDIQVTAKAGEVYDPKGRVVLADKAAG
jgi:hypothetical protein